MGRCFSQGPTTPTPSILLTPTRDRLRLDPKEHPVLLAEPTHAPDADRERVVETMFEAHGPPALFLARDAVLAAFAVGRPTALVVDVGHEATIGRPFGSVLAGW